MAANELDLRPTDAVFSAEKAEFRRSQIKSLFQQYGLTRLETDVYLGLLEYGDSTVRELSLALALNRVEVYRVVKRLLSRGLVSVVRSEPTVYQVVRPSLAIRALIQQFETKAHQMKALAPGLILEL